MAGAGFTLQVGQAAFGLQDELRRNPAALAAEQQVRAAHAEGLRGVQIDRRYGWKQSRAWNIQRRLGLDSRPPAPSGDELRELYAALRTVKAVAARLGIGEKKARHLLRAAGIPGRPGGAPRRHPLDLHAEALRQARIGPDIVPIHVLAARYKVSYDQMITFLHSRGIVVYKILTRAQHDEVVALAGAGLRPAEIGRRIGTSEHTVRQHLRPGPRPRLK